MDLGTMESERDNEDDDGGQDMDSTRDLMGLKGRSGQSQQGTWSVSKMVKNGNRVVFDTPGSDIENKKTKDILWLRERDRVYVVDMMVATPGRENRIMEGGALSRACKSKRTDRGTENVGQRRAARDG